MAMFEDADVSVTNPTKESCNDSELCLTAARSERLQVRLFARKGEQPS